MGSVPKRKCFRDFLVVSFTVFFKACEKPVVHDEIISLFEQYMKANFPPRVLTRFEEDCVILGIDQSVFTGIINVPSFQYPVRGLDRDVPEGNLYLYLYN
jgi:hypothetical protein